MNNATFYFEWLKLDKNEFRILALLAPTGKFDGNLSAICDKLNIKRQQKNRNKIKENIEKLTKDNYLTSCKEGNTYHLKVIPKETIMSLSIDCLNKVVNHEYSAASVAWQQVLKVYLWLLVKNKDVVTRAEIAEDTGIGIDTISAALKVLESDFNAILKKSVTEKISETEYRTKGLNIELNAWWD